MRLKLCALGIIIAASIATADRKSEDAIRDFMKSSAGKVLFESRYLQNAIPSWSLC